jgi:UPF0755 protein
VRALRNLLVLAIVAAVLAGAAWAWLVNVVQAPGPLTNPVRIVVHKGDGLRVVLGTLAEKQLIRYPRAVETWVRLAAPRLQLKAGRYEIGAAASARDILMQIDAGRVLLESITIIEGSRFAELREALERHPEVEQTLRGLSDEQVMWRVSGRPIHPEGRFFPDTYRFAAGSTDVEILITAYRKMSVLLDGLWQERADGLPLTTPEQALTLASIVEKESAVASERPRIAGIFISRLRKGMRLQTDPSVIYGLGDAYDGDIRTRDLRTDGPYNTYTRAGLPPTPIALPGEAALRAALQPQVTGELFFVASPAGDGTHVFSRTYAEHERAVQRWLAHSKTVKPSPASETRP